jgi:hypothetical protein
MIQLHKIATPPQLHEILTKNGSTDIQCYEGAVNKGYISVIKSRDPSGRNNAMEDHLSISIRPLVMGVMQSGRIPTKAEIQSVLNFFQWNGPACVGEGQDYVVHIYKAPSTKNQEQTRSVS